PMDLRPQGQDIIRTWLFSTLLRSQLEHGQLPWKHTAISGWMLDQNRKKMCKSKGNVITPMGLIEQHGADAVRYWAASARLGTDAVFEEGQMKIGRRLAIKILNASKFILQRSLGEEITPLTAQEAVGNPADVTEHLDQVMLSALADVVDEANSSFERYDHTRALEITESLFWAFCDDYLELVKDRAYQEGAQSRSARTALILALDAFLRLFAPFLPFATEEVWSWWRTGSVHQAPWPHAQVLREAAQDAPAASLPIAGAALAALRKVKSEAKVSMRTPLTSAELAVPQGTLKAVNAITEDLQSAGHAQSLTITESDVGEPTVIEPELRQPTGRKKNSTPLHAILCASSLREPADSPGVEASLQRKTAPTPSTSGRSPLAKVTPASCPTAARNSAISPRKASGSSPKSRISSGFSATASAVEPIHKFRSAGPSSGSTSLNNSSAT